MFQFHQYSSTIDYCLISSLNIVLFPECEMWVGSVTNWVKPEQENNSSKISWTPSRGYSIVDHLILGRLKSPKIILLHDGWMRQDNKLFKFEDLAVDSAWLLEQVGGLYTRINRNLDWPSWASMHISSLPVLRRSSRSLVLGRVHYSKSTLEWVHRPRHPFGQHGRLGKYGRIGGDRAFRW